MSLDDLNCLNCLISVWIPFAESNCIHLLNLWFPFTESGIFENVPGIHRVMDTILEVLQSHLPEWLICIWFWFLLKVNIYDKLSCGNQGTMSKWWIWIRDWSIDWGGKWWKTPKLKTQNGACISEATPGSSYQSRPCLHITGAVWSADQCCEERFSWVCNHHGGSISIWVHPEMVSWIIVTLHHRNFSSIHAWFRASVIQSSGKIFWCPRIIGGSKEALRNTSSVLLGLNNNRRSYLAFP